LDLAIYLDLETGYVQRVRAATYQEGGMPGNVMIKVGGLGGDEEEEEVIDEAEFKDADGQPKYKNGLRLRPITKQVSALTFDALFADNGLQRLPELSDRQRELLRLGDK
jgi:hypothetical protein